MREVLIDTETTGVSRSTEYICEIGAVEMIGQRLTGRELHIYIKPPKPMPKEAERIHSLSDAFLADKPPFAHVVDRVLDFIGDDPIVAHNAAFDVGMLNSELGRLNRPILTNAVVDTLDLSRKARPGKKHNLDAICKDYGIDLSKRTKHGALLDSKLLAEVYVELRGGRQATMFDVIDGSGQSSRRRSDPPDLKLIVRDRPHHPRITPQEYVDHLLFVSTIKDSIWASYAADN